MVHSRLRCAAADCALQSTDGTCAVAAAVVAWWWWRGGGGGGGASDGSLGGGGGGSKHGEVYWQCPAGRQCPDRISEIHALARRRTTMITCVCRTCHCRIVCQAAASRLPTAVSAGAHSCQATCGHSRGRGRGRGNVSAAAAAAQQQQQRTDPLTLNSFIHALRAPLENKAAGPGLIAPCMLSNSSICMSRVGLVASASGSNHPRDS